MRASFTLLAVLVISQLPTGQALQARSTRRARPHNRFVKVRGWGPLRWKMSPARAMKQLQQARIRYRHSSSRDQLDTGCRWYNQLRFKHGQWQVTASFINHKLNSVFLERKTRQKNAVLLLVGRLMRKYGKPQRSYPPPRGKPNGPRAVWKNPHGFLTISTRKEKGHTILMQVWSRR